MLVHAAAIALSAFLLFLVQPMIARQLLPWFGGSALVWSTSLVFFQVALLGGYFYADLLVRRCSPKRQLQIHGSLLLLSLLTLPILADPANRPQDALNPAGRVLWLLLTTIGLPYLLLSTTGPLVQAWFARRFAGGAVYRLYALSNLASMLALLGYPALLEPFATTRQQSIGWSAGYALFAGLAILAGWRSLTPLAAAAVAEPISAGDEAKTEQAAVTADPPENSGAELSNGPDLAAAADAPPSWRAQAEWLTLAALGTVLLLALTTHITQNIASIPFLWVLPLATYLLAFILVFDGRGWYWRRFYPAAAAVLALLMLVGLSFRIGDDGLPERRLMHLTHALPLYVGGLFAQCMFLSGELVVRKPHPNYLTRFYLSLSLGGALGGLLVGLVAPVVFDAYWEVPLALTAVAALVAWFSPLPWQKALGAAAAIACICFGFDYAVHLHRDTVELSRSHYGTLRVKASGPEEDPKAQMRLLHGVILHGQQYRSAEKRALPTTYYGETSGIGRAILMTRQESPNPSPQRVGLVGLGTGTLTSYGRPGDIYRVYELSPAVLDAAERWFTYIADCKALIVMVMGDARLSLEREAPQKFDVLAIDAFSSDSVPAHLLTREALQVYLRHLRPGGVIAFHVSNRYLHLGQVVQKLAQDAGLLSWQIVDKPADTERLTRSDWVWVTANRGLVDELHRQGIGAPLAAKEGLRAWSDDYYNLLQVWK